MEQKAKAVGVHVDTFEGMKRGVPVLLGPFRSTVSRHYIFVPKGKNHTGRDNKTIFHTKRFF
jgi:hypothetical protein